MEYRIKDVELSCEDSGALKLGGYINVTNRESEMLYNKKKQKWFKEVMTRGVFSDAISKAKEIPLLFEHNWNKKLASTSDSTLQLREDQIGLRFDATIENREIYDQVKAGIINSCSFGFKALKEGIEEIDSRLEKRYVSEIELLEVSLVKNPAYVGSLCEVRTYEQELEEERKAQEKADEEKEDNSDVKEESVKENSEVEDCKEDTEQDVADEISKEDEEKVDEPKDETSKEDEVKEDDEERQLSGVTAGAVSIESVEEVTTETESTVEKEIVKKVLDEVIKEKEEILEVAECEETFLKEHIEDVKEIHEEIEKDLVHQAMSLSGEIARMRFEILKLQTIRNGV